jgi:branched-chain amino acid transport system permease protein
LHNGILYLGIIVVGGMGTSLGPIAGAIVMKGLDEMVMIVFPKLAELFPSMGANMAPALGPMAFGLVFILFLIFEPRGIAHGWGRLKSSIEQWPFTY